MKLLVTAIFLSLVSLPRPGIAGTLDINVNGVLGPLLQGVDGIGLAGVTFSAAGAIDQNAAPIFSAGDSYTYNLSGDLQLTLGKISLTGYNPELTITATASGADTAVLDFGVSEFGFTPVVEAFLTLPAGTLDGSGVQPFGANISQPDSYLTYAVPGQEDVIYATLGITGSASVGGASPSAAPEPGTVGLLGAGLALAAALRKLSGR